MLHKTLIAVGALLAGTAFAQANVSELLAAGGSKLSKEELQQIHAGGVTMKGTLNNGSPYSQWNKADGSIGGTAGNSGQFSLSGSWKIDDAGKYCHDVAASGGLKFNGCFVAWKSGTKYFLSADEAATTVVRERQFVK